MVAFPPCKINLGLNILRKRDDGFHEIETCFYPIPWTDILEIIPANAFTFAASGIPVPGTIEENLCVKAYHLLKNDFGIDPVSIHLHKIVPMGAGLGGGSSDGALTLRLLNEIFGLHLTSAQLMTYASQLGSDCAFFIQDNPMMGRGRGEILSPIEVSLQGKFLILVKPDVHVSTAEAYRLVTPDATRRRLEERLTHTELKEWWMHIENDFEPSVFAGNASIKQIKDILYKEGALYVSMSGSGSSVFGLFDAERNLEELFAGASYFGTRL